MEYQPDHIKLDRTLIAGIQADPVRQAVVQGLAKICMQLGIEMVAAGIETAHEYHWLRGGGVNIFQGYYFARPVLEAVAEVRPNLF